MHLPFLPLSINEAYIVDSDSDNFINPRVGQFSFYSLPNHTQHKNNPQTAVHQTVSNIKPVRSYMAKWRNDAQERCTCI